MEGEETTTPSKVGFCRTIQMNLIRGNKEELESWVQGFDSEGIVCKDGDYSYLKVGKLHLCRKTYPRRRVSSSRKRGKTNPASSFNGDAQVLFDILFSYFLLSIACLFKYDKILKANQAKLRRFLEKCDGIVRIKDTDFQFYPPLSDVVDTSRNCIGHPRELYFIRTGAPHKP